MELYLLVLLQNALGGISNEYSLLKSTLAADANILLKFKINQFDDFCLFDSILNFVGTQFFVGLREYSKVGGRFWINLVSETLLKERIGVLY